MGISDPGESPAETLDGLYTSGDVAPAYLFKLAKAGRDRAGRLDFLLANPEPPWECYFCHKPIMFLSYGPPTVGCLVVHHINGDHYDHRRGNLAPAHTECHSRYHSTQ